MSKDEGKRLSPAEQVNLLPVTHGQFNAELRPLLERMSALEIAHGSLRKHMDALKETHLKLDETIEALSETLATQAAEIRKMRTNVGLAGAADKVIFGALIEHKLIPRNMEKIIAEAAYPIPEQSRETSAPAGVESSNDSGADLGPAPRTHICELHRVVQQWINATPEWFANNPGTCYPIPSGLSHTKFNGLEIAFLSVAEDLRRRRDVFGPESNSYPRLPTQKPYDLTRFDKGKG